MLRIPDNRTPTGFIRLEHPVSGRTERGQRFPGGHANIQSSKKPGIQNTVMFGPLIHQLEAFAKGLIGYQWSPLPYQGILHGDSPGLNAESGGEHGESDTFGQKGGVNADPEKCNPDSLAFNRSIAGNVDAALCLRPDYDEAASHFVTLENKPFIPFQSRQMLTLKW
jgi:hypothetical protein